MDEAQAKRAAETFLSAVQPTLTEEASLAVYKEWAPNYEVEVDVFFPYTKVVPSAVAKRVAKYMENNKDGRILDIGCGTGLLGLEMTRCGLTNIEGLDMSEEMMKEAKKKKIYKKFTQGRLGDKLNLESNTFDLIVGTAMFLTGYATPACFPELIRVLKPGGTFMGIVAQKWIEIPEDVDPYLIDFEAKIQDHVKAGLWQLEKKELLPQYAGTWDGYIFYCKKN